MNDLPTLISKLNLSELEQFLDDLLTPQERQSFEERWQIAQNLAQGSTYREVASKLNVSTTTVTRVAKAMEAGKGYKAALAK